MIDSGLYCDYELLALRLNSLISKSKAKAPLSESIDITDKKFDQYDIDEQNYRQKLVLHGKDTLQRRRNETVRRRKNAKSN